MLDVGSESAELYRILFEIKGKRVCVVTHSVFDSKVIGFVITVLIPVRSTQLMLLSYTEYSLTEYRLRLYTCEIV